MRRALRNNSVKRGDTASDGWLISTDPSLSHILFYFCFLRFFLLSLLAPSPEKAQLLCITAASCCGPGGGGSSQPGTEVSFLVFHPDQTASTLPNTPPQASQTYPPPSRSPLHVTPTHWLSPSLQEAVVNHQRLSESRWSSLCPRSPAEASARRQRRAADGECAVNHCH